MTVAVTTKPKTRRPRMAVGVTSPATSLSDLGHETTRG